MCENISLKVFLVLKTTFRVDGIVYYLLNAL